jgi:hypothetical protein
MESNNPSGIIEAAIAVQKKIFSNILTSHYPAHKNPQRVQRPQANQA